MPAYAVPVRGRGRATVAAFGVADAEHLVEKEIGRAIPGSAVTITTVARPEDRRLVEEFTVEYHVSAVFEVEAESHEKAAGAAFRRARHLLSGTRYHLTEWSRVSPPAS